jgi:hypothetical protein
MAKRFQTSFRHAGGTLLCDCISDFGFESPLEFTDHPIDDGSTISDHAVRKPETLSLTLTHTQTPLRKIDGFSNTKQQLTVSSVRYGTQKTQLNVRSKGGPAPNIGALIEAGVAAVRGAIPSSLKGLKVLPAQGQEFGITVLQADAPVDRIGTFFSELLRLQAAVTRLTLSFKGRDYGDFVLTSVSKSDKPGRLGASSFQVSLKRIRTVAAKQVSLPAVPRAKQKKDRGVQYGPPLPPVTEEKIRKSVAAQLTDLALQ